MRNPENKLLFAALLTTFALATGTNAADSLSSEAQHSLEASHQNSQGFEPGQHPQYAHFPAAKRAIAKRLSSMSPEERLAAKAKFENMSAEERETARAEIQDRVQSQIQGRIQGQIQSRVGEQGLESNQLQTL